MEGKDTVMNETLIQTWCLEFVQPGELDLNAKLKEFAQAQAEISFGEGVNEGVKQGYGKGKEAEIKEVVEWAKCSKPIFSSVGDLGECATLVIHIPIGEYDTIFGKPN